jgi:hypothetical protein
MHYNAETKIQSALDDVAVSGLDFGVSDLIKRLAASLADGRPIGKG